MLSDFYSDSDEYGSESEELSDEDYEKDESNKDDQDAENNSEGSCSYEDSDHGSSSRYSESGDDDHSKGSFSSISNPNEGSNDNQKDTTRRRSAKKGSPFEDIELVAEQQAEILRLEANKIKLKERIEAQARRNEILQEDLVSKKKTLEKHRVALSEEVSRLEETLQKVPLSTSTDEKTNAEQDDKDQSEGNDHELPHNQLGEQNSDDPGLQHNEKEYESTTTSHRSKAANTTSALSKITNRLNFLKERHNQIVDELFVSKFLERSMV